MFSADVGIGVETDAGSGDCTCAIASKVRAGSTASTDKMMQMPTRGFPLTPRVRGTFANAVWSLRRWDFGGVS